MSTNSVSFSTIQIRSYDLTIGDSPSVSSGIPLSLDWHFVEFEEIPVQDYEEDRARRRSGNSLKLSAVQRSRILVESFGISPFEIKKTMRRRMIYSNKRIPSKTSKRNPNKTIALKTNFLTKPAKLPTNRATRYGPPAAA